MQRPGFVDQLAWLAQLIETCETDFGLLVAIRITPSSGPSAPSRRPDTGELQDATVMLSRSSVRGFTSEVTSISAMGPIPEWLTLSAS